MRTEQEVFIIVNDMIKEIEKIFPNVNVETILFGSYARHDADEESDIDILFLVDTPREEINRRMWDISSAASELLLKYGVMVSPLVENRAFFQHYCKSMPFFGNIQREGVVISA